MWNFILKNRAILIAVGLLLALVIWLNAAPSQEPKGFVKQENESPAVESEARGDTQQPRAEDLYSQAMELKESGQWLEAKALYRKVYNQHPDYERIEDVQKELEALNMQILFSSAQTADTVWHEVVRGDTLGKLAKKYETTIELIKISNNLDSNVIRIGQKLRIWKAPFNIYVDKSQNILLLKQGDEVLKVYNVSTGKGSSTPVGEFTITTRLKDPVWFNKGVVVPPDSPANVLGSRWLGFDTPGYGIHGTIEPETIGQQVTAGCVRMRNTEVEELFNIIPTGTEVKIVD